MIKIPARASWRECPSPSKSASPPRELRPTAALEYCADIFRPMMPTSSSGSRRKGPSSWARPTWTSLPWAPPPRRAALGRQKIPGISTAFRAAPAAEARLLWPGAKRPALWARIRAAQCAVRHPFAASWDSSPPTAWSRATAWWPMPTPWSRSARLPIP